MENDPYRLSKFTEPWRERKEVREARKGREWLFIKWNIFETYVLIFYAEVENTRYIW